MCLQCNRHQRFREKERRTLGMCSKSQCLAPALCASQAKEHWHARSLPLEAGSWVRLTCSSPNQSCLGDCTSLRGGWGFQQGSAFSQAGCRNQTTTPSSTPKVWQFDLDEFRAGTVYSYSRDHIPSAWQPLLMWALPKWDSDGFYRPLGCTICSSSQPVG